MKTFASAVGIKNPTALCLGRLGCTAAGLVLACTAMAHAAVIPITNPGFNTDLSGWNVTADYAATVDPTGFNPSYPDGLMLDLNAPDNTPLEGQGSINQILATDWAVGSYELTLTVQQPYFGLPEHEGTPGALDGGVEVDLIDATTLAVLGTTTFVSSDDALHSLAVDATVGAGNGAIGDPIEIVMTHTLNGDTWIDDLSLNSPPVGAPEPGSLSLLAVGLIGIAR
ncbi:MAG TPA: hypothetical protein VGG99_13875 [Acetobacteraceae bacterium]|jgi:hypothetical protein